LLVDYVALVFYRTMSTSIKQVTLSSEMRETPVSFGHAGTSSCLHAPPLVRFEASIN